VRDIDGLDLLSDALGVDRLQHLYVRQKIPGVTAMLSGYRIPTVMEGSSG
jgi:hypothetical protein